MDILLAVVLVGWMANLSTSIYAHRAVAHRALVLHPVVAHLFRCILWCSTGTSVRAWVAVHRKHHALADRQGDPHSPQRSGLWQVVFFNYFYYRRERHCPATLQRYADGPNDWFEHHIYAYPFGLLLLMGGEIALLGWPRGPGAFGLQLLWMPLCGGMINGFGHALGYRNFATHDASRNIVPFALFVAGEELHNNHHRYPGSAKFSWHWWEIDPGWLVVRGLAVLGLAKNVRVHDQPRSLAEWADLDTPFAKES